MTTNNHLGVLQRQQAFPFLKQRPFWSQKIAEATWISNPWRARAWQLPIWPTGWSTSWPTTRSTPRPWNGVAGGGRSPPAVVCWGGSLDRKGEGGPGNHRKRQVAAARGQQCVVFFQLLSIKWSKHFGDQKVKDVPVPMYFSDIFPSENRENMFPCFFKLLERGLSGGEARGSRGVGVCSAGRAAERRHQRQGGHGAPGPVLVVVGWKDPPTGCGKKRPKSIKSKKTNATKRKGCWSWFLVVLKVSNLVVGNFASGPRPPAVCRSWTPLNGWLRGWQMRMNAWELKDREFGAQLTSYPGGLWYDTPTNAGKKKDMCLKKAVLRLGQHGGWLAATLPATHRLANFLCGFRTWSVFGITISRFRGIPRNYHMKHGKSMDERPKICRKGFKADISESMWKTPQLQATACWPVPLLAMPHPSQHACDRWPGSVCFQL